MKPLIVVSGAVSQKCVMRKRQDVNMLSRKKQFHGQMSWDMKVTKKDKQVSVGDLRAFSIRGGVEANKGAELAAFPKLAWTQRRAS